MRGLTRLSWISVLYFPYRPDFCPQGTGDSSSNECCEKKEDVLQLGNTQTSRRAACGFWQEIPTGQCQMHFEMMVPMFRLLLVNNLAVLTVLHQLLQALLCETSFCVAEFFPVDELLMKYKWSALKK